MQIRLGTRGSRLALCQAEWVRTRLAAAGYRVALVEIRTTGDLVGDTPLAILDRGDAFTRQIDEALLSGEIDLAVHSLKDLPTTLPDGIILTAVCLREDPRDALVAREPVRLQDLPTGSVVATCSLRRRAQLLRTRPDLSIADLRGNVDRRIARLDQSPEWGAIILAVAGLNRLGRADRITQYFDPDVMLPAPGQGALAITAPNVAAELTRKVHDLLHDRFTGFCTTAERAVLQFLGCGCHAPVAALATLDQAGLITLRARVLSISGEQQVEASLTARAGTQQEALALGGAAAEQLLERGASGLLALSSAEPP